MATASEIPAFRALNHYPGRSGRPARPTRAREDILIHFLAGPSSVSLGAPPPGDYVDRPTGYDVHPLAVTELRNAALTREGFVFTERDEVLRESIDRRSYFDQFIETHSDLHAELSATAEEATPEAVVALTGQRTVNYFHWWIDVLARCWAIRNSPYRSCKFVTPPLTREFQQESLQALGLEATPLTQPIQRFQSVVFTRGFTYGSSQDIAPQVSEFASWCRETLALSSQPPRRKLFLSRRAARGRGVVNEDEVVAALGGGFESVELEKMSVPAQAELFSQVSVIIAPHGAGLTNLLFCGGSAAVVELMHEDVPPPYTYRRLAGLLGHRYIAVACPSEGPQRDASRRDLRPAAADVVDAVAGLDESAGY